jgi:hydrogenase maturation protein HypF
MALQRATLPVPGPARVLACGAFLKNSACLIEGDQVLWSPVHGDLADPASCEALDRSLAELQVAASGPLQAVAHDLHPDFFSTHAAQALAARLAVPAIGVQHHHAHIAVAQAEQGITGPVIGLALDGVGWGTDGTAWGGEVLWVDTLAQAHRWHRLGHLPSLALPGGDVAAREPWRMAAAALHATGHAEQIVPRFGTAVGEGAARLLAQMLERGLNCPATTSAGRWFDAVAGLLRLSVRQGQEAEAAIALERAAADWLQAHPGVAVPWPSLDLRPLVGELLALCPPDAAGDALAQAQGRGAAMFHLALAGGLSHAAIHALRHPAAVASQTNTATAPASSVVLGGGCLFNRVLNGLLCAQFEAAGIHVAQPRHASCGDAGLALGQAWVAACAWAQAAQSGTVLEAQAQILAVGPGVPSPKD